MRQLAIIYGLTVGTILTVAVATSLAGEWDAAIATVRNASPVEGVSAETRTAWNELAAADRSALPTILRAMKDANPAAENWLRAAADAIAERSLASDNELPISDLQALFDDKNASPRGRRVAYEWIARVDN
ncbi:MAG: hypothetical protein ACR2NU_02285, partial [Aeoliella sp.]